MPRGDRLKAVLRTLSEPPEGGTTNGTTKIANAQADWPRTVSNSPRISAGGSGDVCRGEESPAYPLLYSVQGSQYCDLRLTEAERAAWLATLDCGSLLPLSATQPAASALGPGILDPTESGGKTPADASRLADESGSRLPQSKALRDVEQCAAHTLKWVTTQDWLLALDHLTLGRAAFYAAIFGRAEEPLDPGGTGFQPVGQLPDDDGRLEAYPTVELADARAALLPV